VAVDAAGNIYLTDSSAARVIKLDRNGNLVTSWGSAGSGPGQFSTLYPGSAAMGIAVGPNGHVYVSDTWNGRVQEFTPNGKFVRAFGRPNPNLNGGGAPADDTFYGPRQLAVAPNGNIYVADTGNERIQVYSPQGQHLFNIGAGSHKPETAGGRFDEPSGVAIDGKGIVYVADYWDQRIQRFTLDGRYLSSIPISGWTSGDYGEPYLTVDKTGHLFATDSPLSLNRHVNHVLMLDASTGKMLRAFGSGGAGTGTLSQPSGIAVGPDGNLYITDTTALVVYKVHP
jgi:sugar lactone lactonase YvrE